MGPNCLQRLSADDTRRQRLYMPDLALNWLANNEGQDQSLYADQGLCWQPLLKGPSHYIVALSPYRWVWMVLTLCMLGNFSCFCCRLLTFFKINFFQKFFQEHYQSVKLFGSRSGPTFCRSWSGSKLFAKFYSRQQKFRLINSFRNTIRVSNCLDPDQDRHSVGLDLGPNCLQSLSTDNKISQAMKELRSSKYHLYAVCRSLETKYAILYAWGAWVIAEYNTFLSVWHYFMYRFPVVCHTLKAIISFTVISRPEMFSLEITM